MPFAENGRRRGIWVKRKRRERRRRAVGLENRTPATLPGTISYVLASLRKINSFPSPLRYSFPANALFACLLLRLPLSLSLPLLPPPRPLSLSLPDYIFIHRARRLPGYERRISVILPRCRATLFSPLLPSALYPPALSPTGISYRGDFPRAACVYTAYARTPVRHDTSSVCARRARGASKTLFIKKLLAILNCPRGGLGFSETDGGRIPGATWPRFSFDHRREREPDPSRDTHDRHTAGGGY